MVAVIDTGRLVLRSWTESDAQAALAIYGAPSVIRWLSHWVPGVDGPESMRTTIRGWLAEDEAGTAPDGHWAVQDDRGDLVGGISLAHVPSPDGSVTLRSELAPASWGNGYAAEAGEALVHWAMHEAGVIDVFALVQPDNTRAAAMVERIGMEWELDLDSGLRVFRIRHGDLDCVDPLDLGGPGARRRGV